MTSMVAYRRTLSPAGWCRWKSNPHVISLCQSMSSLPSGEATTTPPTTTTTTTTTNTAVAATNITTRSRMTSKQLVNTMRERAQQQQYLDDSEQLWESLWKDGITPWDLGGPTKVLIHELQRKNFRPTTSLIPGCGSGYDLVSLGRYLDSENPKPLDQPYIIWGLELSETSLQRARTILQESQKNHGPFQQITIWLYKGDFFCHPSTWTPFYSTTGTGIACTNDKDDNSIESSSSFLLDQQHGGRNSTTTTTTTSFSFIFDYTFFCAIPPKQRKAWGEQMEQLLAPDDGQLFTLIFPYHPLANKVDATSKTRGPPYLLSVDMYQSTLKHLSMETSMPFASLATPSQRQGQEVVAWWYKAKL